MSNGGINETMIRQLFEHSFNCMGEVKAKFCSKVCLSAF